MKTHTIIRIVGQKAMIQLEGAQSLKVGEIIGTDENQLIRISKIGSPELEADVFAAISPDLDSQDPSAAEVAKDAKEFAEGAIFYEGILLSTRRNQI